MATHGEVVQVKAAIARIETQLEAVSAQIHKATFNAVMTGCDLSEFFPVERKEQLEQFMDRSHPEWNNRKAEFYHFLYTIASKNKRGFARGMIKAMFAREYINQVKWPSYG